MPVGRPVGHHAADHGGALALLVDRDVVGGELGRLVLQRLGLQARLVRQQHREQLGRMTDPLAQHPEVAGADGVAVDQRHPLQEAGPVGWPRRAPGRRPGSRASCRRWPARPTAPATFTISARAQSASGCSLAMRRQAQVGGVVGQPEDERAQPVGGAHRDGRQLRGRPARFDEVRHPDAADRQAQRALGLGQHAVDQVHLLGVLDLGEHDAVERDASVAGAFDERPQQAVQLARRSSRG